MNFSPLWITLEFCVPHGKKGIVNKNYDELIRIAIETIDL